MIKSQTNNEYVASIATENMDVNKGRPVHIFRSADQENTGIYFGGRDDKMPDFFELILFGYKFGKPEIFLRYLGSEHYVQIFGAGGSSHGNMKTYGGRDLVQEKLHPFIYEGWLQPKKVEIQVHGEHAVINFDGYGTSFNFLKMVASYNQPSYDKTISFGKDFVEQMLARKYAPLPKSRRIEYAYNLPDGNMVIVDASAYEYDYSTLVCRYGNASDGFKIAEISDFARYRDGGSTLFDAKIGDKIYKFLSPTRLGDGGFHGEKNPKWNEIIMTEMDKNKIVMMVKLLFIDLAPEVKR